MTRRLLTVFIVTLSASLVLQASAQDENDHHEGADHRQGNGHDEHEHEAPSGVGESEHEDIDVGDDSHSDHDHGEHEDGLIELTLEAVKMAGIQLARVGRGRIGTSIHVPGEVGFDEDRLVHVVPRFAGVAKEVFFRVGDRVTSDDVVAVVEGNESLNRYSITAPISGWVIEKHVTSGEFVSEEAPIYIIADLTHVWVDLAVYPKDADRVAPGQEVTLHAIGSDLSTVGTIEYITPVLDARTRSMTARIVLPNPKNRWRPGTFVHADIVAGYGEEHHLVENNAVQILDDRHVVFVPHDEARFRPVPVTIGDSDARFTEILDGLDEGIDYVAAGAFELKAEIVTSALGGHAGHGH